jgi:hypothetical protein
MRSQRYRLKVFQEDEVSWLNRSVNGALQRLRQDLICMLPEKLS